MILVNPENKIYTRPVISHKDHTSDIEAFGKVCNRTSGYSVQVDFLRLLYTVLVKKVIKSFPFLSYH